MKQIREDPISLRTLLGLDEERLRKILTLLQELKIIEVDKNGIRVIRKNLHLPKASKTFHCWKSQMRQMALQRSLQVDPEKTYNFSVLFTSTEKIKEDIQDMFFNFISEAQKKTKNSKAEKVFQMNFDLLPWL